ncbi:hypothetical protein ES706_05655 [subsurface metagenome]
MLKLKFKKKIFIHRVDGPISKIRDNDFQIDRKIYLFNNLIADGTIFQSNWSREENLKLGMNKNQFEETIINASDPLIFNPKNKKKFSNSRKTKLISSSWSSNWNKGFKIYQYLDQNLDFSKYEMTFIGNSPIEFKNIRWIKPVTSEEMAKHLKKHDIFIIASRKDPCSNSLIEALTCGLPAIVLDDGGHPEILDKSGEIFKNENDILKKIEKIAQNYNYYQNNIRILGLDLVKDKYYNFSKKIYQNYLNKTYIPKKINIFQSYKLFLFILTIKLKIIFDIPIINKIFDRILKLIIRNI